MRARGSLWLGIAVSALLPVCLYAYTRQQIRSRLVPALATAALEPVHIGTVELSLFGTLRVEDLTIGESLSVQELEASVGMQTLMRGDFAPDEVRVVRPRVRARMNPDGSLDLSELLARLRRTRAKSSVAGGGTGAEATARTPRLRRIVVAGGELVVTLRDIGVLEAPDVELWPQRGGVRVVAHHLRANLVSHGLRVRGSFARGALDIRLPELIVERAALDGGALFLGRHDPPDGSTPERPHAPARATIGGDDPSSHPSELHLASVVVMHDARAHRLQLAGEIGGGEYPGKFRVTGSLRGPLIVEASGTDIDLSPLDPFTHDHADLHAARFRGAASLEYQPPAQTLTFRGQGRLVGFQISDSTIARPPLPIDGELAWAGSYRLPDRLLKGEILYRKRTLELAARGKIKWPYATDLAVSALDVSLDIKPVACAELFAALPQPLAQQLAGLDIEGMFTAKAHVWFGFDAPAPALEANIGMRCRVLTDPDSAPVAALAGPYAHTLPTGKTRTLSTADADFVLLASLPGHVPAAFVAGEDARFFSHKGFDPEQIRRSLAANVQAGRIERGGSTISQQLVKNLFLSRERTLSRKLVEALLTWRLEELLGKKRILEIYLNVIELGKGVFGLVPAARRWFGKSPKDLTLVEAAFLAALTPAPVSMERRLVAQKDWDEYTLRRVRAVLASMKRNRFISDAEYERARNARPILRF